MSARTGILGTGMDRSDGRLKVTGAARFSAEHPVPRAAHAVIVQSAIAKGRIASIDARAAEAMRGVLLVMTHKNAPDLPAPRPPAQDGQPPGPKLSLLQDDEVFYNGQPIAVVVADTLEHAQDAARRVKVRYAPQKALLDYKLARLEGRKPASRPERPADTSRGNVPGAMARAAVKVDALYTTPIENHNPMEPHATIAAWEGDTLTLYDSTQNVSGVRKTVAARLGIAPENVRVICPYVGGGFGCKGNTWSHVVLAAMAAREAGCPVKLALERTQMYGPVGARPMTEQHLGLGAAADGKLAAVTHDTISHTSFLDDFTEPCGAATRILYASDSLRTTQRLATMNLGVPTYMRAPGEASGSFALESALDELAYALGMDPVRLRLRNYAERDPEKDLPWSSKSLRECYRVGAERFGWARRSPAPGSMRAGRALVGWGMATATYPANRQPARASATILADGTAVVRSGSHELGTGTYTVMTQIAAEALGLPVDRVRFELGDTAMPQAPVSGGSMTVASVGPAVHAAARTARDALVAMAVADPASPLHRADDVTVENGWLLRRGAPDTREPVAAVIARHGGEAVHADSQAAPGDERKQYSMHSFGAVFVEVHVDPDLGTIRVPRVVGAYGVGRLMNAKTGHSQLMGGIVWGLGMALTEKTEMDWRTGRAVNANLADYHVPVNADVGAIDITVVDEHDPHINALGAKGIGEIGITGVAAAVANAVYHATGKRFRDLPITPDKMI
ncbi:xanthine dehydrogenase family protein molybdopterin-binding subunit [Pseudoduganella namucuonensis]|uniref:Xanthine dehydrogenase YagR molybdenum-binding subunit n=1 Tax=Pseudoduganella namucuonensis TaxID=1035707 RepID=A0A1I7JVW4_9BURK|nr:xanthine dehydrogenase family protein molybdopterin-binding subunit [Pseudoduganella namucuonensis]SFU89239.1 xanthine dehydrogenase YagR molybdenum-binding subunit [Pseudoduganella namucuonensis]